MKYRKTKEAVFLERPNRFVARVLADGKEEVVHVKNTGRCRELLIPGCRVILSQGDNPARKTKYDLIAVWKAGLGLVNIDSQAPNAAVREWLQSKPKGFEDLTLIRPEYVFGKSRVDFYLEGENRKILMEVKGCTLERNCVGFFPDAPTERGIKHINELISATLHGYECFLAFVIAMPGVKTVFPNVETHPAFGKALAEAVMHGVKVLYLPCGVAEGSLEICEGIDGTKILQEYAKTCEM